MSTEDSKDNYLEKAKDLFDLSFACKKELDPTQLQIYAQHLSECQDVIGAHVLANSDSTNKYAFPKGQVIMYPAEAMVKAESLQKGLYDHLVLARILAPKNEESELNDAFFREKTDALNGAAPQRVGNPARLAFREDDGGKDINYWSPSLGDHGWAGIVKVRHKSGRDEDAVYYVAVKAGVDQAVEDFIGEFSDDKKPKNVTFEHLIRYDRDHGYLKKLGERNAKHLAFRIAEAIGVRIHQTKDSKAYTRPRSQEDKPTMALILDKDFCQPLSSLSMTKHSNPLFVKPVAAFMSMCVSPENVKEQCLVMVDPYVGLVGLKMNPAYKKKQAIEIKSVALPTSTGRIKSPDQVKTEGRSIKKRLKGVTWEQKNGSINDKIAPDAYRQFGDDGDEFIQAVAASGWNPRWGTVHYVPVVMKLANRKLN